MSTAPRAASALMAALAMLVLPAPLRATPPFAAAARALPAPLRHRLLGRGPLSDALFVRPGRAVTWTAVPQAALDALTGDAGELSVGALRRALLDQSAARVGAPAVRASAGLDGRGVAVAVVDTGLDVGHADLRRPDGTTRVAWLLDLSRPARGAHPELEARFGLVRGDGARYGAVYSAADLDARLAAGAAAGELPTDPAGHGTFVASIAAGNGLATGRGRPAGRYVGVAPAATLIAVRASSDEAPDRFTDAAIVAGTAFALDRARAMRLPVVVNLSVGSHHGSHDGASALERALAALAPPDAPGVAVVVSAGNDGTDPVHARVDLLPGAPGTIALDVPQAPPDDVVGVEVVYEGTAELAVRFPSGETTPFVAAGQARGFGTADAVVGLANATDAPPDAPGPATEAPVRTASVLFAGDPQRGRARRAGRFALLVRGAGAVHAYLAERGAGFVPARFAGGALADGTVTVPATSPAVVAVGATVTRLRWPAADGTETTYDPAAAAVLLELDTVAPFSARGPNRLNAPRPDLLAPGGFVIAALSAQASPEQPASPFTGAAVSLVADDGVHVAGAGTSAAAPHVTGAMALLFQARPGATQGELLAALAATARGQGDGGAARWNAAEGWGEIAVDRALEQLATADPDGPVDRARSELTTSTGAVAPDEPVTVLVRLRGPGDVPARAASHRVTVQADRGTLGPVTGLGGGRYSARWRARGVRPGDVATLSAAVDGQALAATATVHIVRDVANGRAGHAARGGCAVARRPGRARAPASFAALLVVLGCVASRPRRAARAARVRARR